MNSARIFQLVLILCWLSRVNFACAQSRVIELQITSDSRAVVGTQQQWMEMLQNVGADRVVIKTGPIGSPTIEESKLGGTTLIAISGTIHGSRLLLPGGSFSIRDQAGITALIKQLRDDGAAIALAEKKAFGLTSEQLVELHTALSKPLNFSTQGMSVGAVIEKISDLIGMKFRLNAAAQRAVPDAAAITEELEGISAGTAMAVIVRPLELVLQPERPQGKPLELQIVNPQPDDEYWPIGWPLDRSPVQTEPKMFERLALEIRGFPLDDALNAIETRTGVPFLYDYQALSREGIELSKTKVTLVTEKISYQVAVGKLLRQSKPRMIEELRVDESGKPFLWISTP